MPARFNEEPAEVMNAADLERANEKLEGHDDEKSSDDKSSDNIDPQRTNDGNGAKMEKLGTYDKYEITEDDCYAVSYTHL